VSDFGSVLAVPSLNAADLAKANLSVPNEFRTNGKFWEQHSLPKADLEKHPTTTEVRILDDVNGRSSGLFPHIDGSAPVAAYVPFANDAVALGGNDMSMTDLDHDGVPQVSVAVSPSNALDLVKEFVRFGDPDDHNANIPGASGLLSLGVVQASGGFAPFCKIVTNTLKPSAPIETMDHPMPVPVQLPLAGTSTGASAPASQPKATSDTKAAPASSKPSETPKQSAPPKQQPQSKPVVTVSFGKKK
jgi:hypothetical protein